MIKNKKVPVKQTALYHLIDLFKKKDSISPSDSWAEVTTAGSKGLLSKEGFNWLVSTIQNDTLGRKSMPLSKVKHLVEERIKLEWHQKYKFTKPLPKPYQYYLQQLGNLIPSLMLERVSFIECWILEQLALHVSRIY